MRKLFIFFIVVLLVYLLVQGTAFQVIMFLYKITGTFITKKFLFELYLLSVVIVFGLFWTLLKLGGKK